MSSILDRSLHSCDVSLVTTPVASWTPNEAWFFAELACRSLVVTSEDGVPIDGARVEISSKSDSIRLLLHVDEVDPARHDHVLVALRPRRVDGSAWRDVWLLEILRPDGGESWLLEPNAPAISIPIEEEMARESPFSIELRVKRRGVERHGEKLPITDVAFHCHTLQSSSSSRARGDLGWAPPTAAENTPWWEIDLAKQVYVFGLRLEIAGAGLPPSATVTLDAYAFRSKDVAAPPAGCFRRTFATREMTRTHDGYLTVDLPCDAIARFVRVGLVAPSGVVLEVAALEVLAADVFTSSLAATMRRAFAVHHDKIAFMLRTTAGTYEPHLSYGEVWERSNALAVALARRLEPASRPDGRVRLALVLRNCVEWVMCDLAAIVRGYVVMPLSPEDTDERLATILERARPDAIVCESKDAARLRRLGEGHGLRVVIESDESYADLLSKESRSTSPVPPPPQRSQDDLYSVLFTSGSTGTPKGAMRTYASFHAMLESYGALQAARHVSFQPLSHLSERMGMSWLLISGALITFSHGGAHLVDELRAFGPTELSSVPRLFDVLYAQYKRRVSALVAAEPDAPLGNHEKTALAEARASFGPNLRAVSVGSAPVSAEVFAFMQRCFSDIWVSEGYGSTELGTIAIDNRIVPGVEVKLVPIVALEKGSSASSVREEAPERGEIWVRTKHMISGYLGDEQTPVAGDEGYFATGDLGERAPDGSVKVIGRLRNAVKLAHGEFVAAETIERVLATSPLVDRIYVHAESGAPGISVLVFPAEHARTYSADAITSALRRHGQRGGLSAWELPRGALLEVSIAPTTENGLLTNVGKLARAAIAERYGADLSRLAAGAWPHEEGADDAGEGEEEEHDYEADLRRRVVRLTSRVLGRPVTPQTSLRDESAGIDSLVVSEVLAAISAELGREVPLSMWFEVATLDELAQRLAMSGAQRPAGATTLEARAREDRSSDLRAAITARLAVLSAAPATTRPPRSIVLTGATGLLGAHLVESLLRIGGEETRLTCIVRADSDAAARSRLEAVLASYEITARPSIVVAGDLSKPRLGLGDVRYDELARDVDAIVHSAAEVSWLAPYETLRGPNVLGTIELLELAATHQPNSTKGPKAFHFVSTISTAPADGDETTMLSFTEVLRASPYALTKWIAEEHVRALHGTPLPVTVYRPAMIAAHSARGHGNPDDFVHRYLTGVTELGTYLDIEDARLDMTPVDYVADAIAALVFAPRDQSAKSETHVETHHLVNVDQSMSYAAVGRALRKLTGLDLVPASYDAFRAALAAAPASRLHPLLPYFPETGFTMTMGPWPSSKTKAAVRTLGVSAPVIDEAILAKVVASLAKRGRVHMMR